MKKISKFLALTALLHLLSFTAHAQAFVTIWKTDNPGSSASNEITIPTNPFYFYDYDVYWEEVGNPSSNGTLNNQTGSVTIAFPTISTYRIEITGNSFPTIFFYNDGNPSDAQKILTIEQWGSNPWKSMRLSFYSCTNLTIPALDAPELSDVTDMSHMFRGAASLNQDISNWNVSNVVYMGAMFNDATSFNQDISGWDVSNVRFMDGMFYNATSFNQNIEGWNVSNVEYMNNMFHNATSFNQDIGPWDVGSVISMREMFYSATSFNQNIGGWNVGNVVDMFQMFNRATSFNGNIGNWNVSGVTNMAGMFELAFSFNQDIGNWDVSNVTQMGFMFYNALSFNQDIGNWDVSNVLSMSGMFAGTPFNHDISSWDVSNITSMYWMFVNATAFNQDISGWNVSNVTNMDRTFQGAVSFNQNIGSWNTTAVTSMYRMFSQASAFNQNIGMWTLNPGVTMDEMLDNSGMDCNNYSATLIGWSANPSTPNGRTLRATGRQYGTNADAARTNLTTTKGWTITGDTPSGAVCDPPSLIPAITYFTPISGPISSTVTIIGTNFDPVGANNTIKFNGVDAATPSAASATSLTVTVPTGATTGPISVTTLAGTGTSTTDFIVICTPPSPPTATNVSRCGDGTVTLSATGATGTQEYRWYDVASGGTSLSSTTTYTTPALTITTPYYVSIFDVATSCESNRTQVDAIVNTPPVAPAGINNSGCSGTDISISASGGLPGQYRWYTVATGGTPDASQTNDTFVSPTPLTANTSFWVSIHDGTCESTRTEVVATIVPLPTSPTVQTPEAVCPGANVLLVASGATGGQYRWYEGGSLITGATGSTFTAVNISANRTFEVSVFDLCESPKTSVTATVVDCTLPPAKEPSVIGSSGDYFASANGSLAWTLGEVITETFANGTKILTQGFHQPLAYIITGTPEEGAELAVYPNPTRDWLTIKTSVTGDYHIELSNLQGQKVVDQTANGIVDTYLHKIDMNGLTSAVYMLRITNTRTGKTSTYKILKY